MQESSEGILSSNTAVANPEEPFSAENNGGQQDDDGSNSGSMVYIPISIVVREAVRRLVVKEHPATIHIPLMTHAGESKGENGGKKRLVPISDDALYDTIKEKTGKIGLAYTSKKCTLCESLGFRVCNKSYDEICVFCESTGSVCEFGLSKKRIKSKIKDTNLPREWLYDCNRKMCQLIPGFKMAENSSLYANCGIIPEEYCLETSLLDSIHRAASHHCQIHENWYEEDLFNKFDSSALLAFGYLAEEIVKDQIRGHLVANEEDWLARRRKVPKIPEFQGAIVDFRCKDNQPLLERIHGWNSQAKHSLYSRIARNKWSDPKDPNTS